MWALHLALPALMRVLNATLLYLLVFLGILQFTWILSLGSGPFWTWPLCLGSPAHPEAHSSALMLSSALFPQDSFEIS